VRRLITSSGKRVTNPLASPAPTDSFRLDDSVFGDAPDDPALDIQMGAPAPEGDHAFNPSSTFSNEHVDAQARSAEGLVFEGASASVDDFADPFENLFNSQEESVSTEAQEAPAKGARPADAQDEDQYMVVDFERTDAQDQADRGLLSFDMNSKGAADRGPGDTFEFTSEKYTADHLEGATDPNHVSASPAFDASSQNFELPGSGLEFIEQPLEEVSPGALFAGDDPLGDVLMGASVEEEPQVQSAEAQESEPFSVEQADNPLNIEVAPPSPGPAAFSWDQGVDLASASAGENDALSFEENFSSSQFSATAEGHEPEAARYQPAVEEHAFTTGEMFDQGPSEVAEAGVKASGGQQDSGWGETSTGFEFSDPGFHPIDQEEAGPLSGADDAFTAASMWSGQNARTASIDIEATAVEEPQPVAYDPGTASEEAKSARLSPTQAPTQGAPESQGRAERTGPAALELSPSVIDEIVRRVVAQMSESVVKEIAWEVVPDCVERVIENLTRESLSKNR
jgi:hypothetical protein